MTDIYISYEWRIVLCAIFMLHIRLLYRTTAEKVKGVHRMRVEQQSQNIIDVVKQSIGPEEKSGAVLSQEPRELPWKKAVSVTMRNP